MNAMLTSLAAAGQPLRAQSGHDFWMPPQASTVAPHIDGLFNIILAISAFFFVLIVVLMIVFIMKYRAERPGDEALSQVEHNTPLEITWTVIPLILVCFIFWWGFKGYLDLVTSPGNASSIQVTAQKWSWLFSYPNGYSDAELHVPVDTPIKLVMSSQDVIHSFFCPAFRVKMDVLPGRYTSAWFTATTPGEYQVFCAEFCGKDHSNMLSKVVVHTAADYQQWLDKAANWMVALPPAEAGAILYKKYGCKQCHTVDGSANTGPTFKALFGTKQPLKDGGTVLVDENYVRESILEPNAHVAAGFEPVMPTFKGRIKDEEIGAVIEYLRSLK